MSRKTIVEYSELITFMKTTPGIINEKKGECYLTDPEIAEQVNKNSNIHWQARNVAYVRKLLGLKYARNEQLCSTISLSLEEIFERLERLENKVF